MSRIDLPLTCLVTDRRRCLGRPLEDVVAAALDGGVGLVQLREKDLPASRLFELTIRLRRLTDGRALLFVNDRVDVALAAGADVVQLAENSMPLAAARKVAGQSLLLGRSVHSVEGGVAAESDGADLLVVGTVFASASHPVAVPGGTKVLRELQGRVGIPYLAIGGVTARSAEAVIRAGAAGVAVITAITQAEDPARAAHEIASAAARAWASEAKAAAGMR